MGIWSKRIGCGSGCLIVLGLFLLIGLVANPPDFSRRPTVQVPPAGVQPQPAVARPPEQPAATEATPTAAALRASGRLPKTGGPELEPDDLADVVDGLPKRLRVEIYQQLYRAGMLASYEAEAKYPFKTLERANADSFLARRQKVYEAAKKRGRVALVKRYNVDGATLDRIDKEGAENRWPLPEVPNPNE